MPPTIQALLQARLDQLAAAERSVIERGAVEGEVFHRARRWPSLASSRCEAGSTAISRLIRNELIRPETATMPGDDAFRFRHLLIRDAAYDSLPKETRADLHERFALWVEEHVQLVEQDEIVGYHLEQAVLYRRELGRDERSSPPCRERLGAAGPGRSGAWRQPRRDEPPRARDDLLAGRRPSAAAAASRLLRRSDGSRALRATHCSRSRSSRRPTTSVGRRTPRRSGPMYGALSGQTVARGGPRRILRGDRDLRATRRRRRSRAGDTAAGRRRTGRAADAGAPIARRDHARGDERATSRSWTARGSCS